MKKIMKWMAIATLGGFAVLLAVGLLLPDDSGSKIALKPGAAPAGVVVQPAEQVATASQVNYASDQCLDGVCIGMRAGELARKSWLKKNVVEDSDLNEQQRELLAGDEQAHTEKCLLRQSTAWGSQAQAMCNLLARGASNSRGYGFRPIQMSKVIDFFANQNMPVCDFYENERVKVVGHLPTESGNTEAVLKFDATGILRVWKLSKPYKDQNAETNSEIASKLSEKHPYVTTEVPPNGSGRKSISGQAPWGGTVRIERKEGEAPMIWMTAKPADFDQSNLVVCKKAKPVSVQ